MAIRYYVHCDCGCLLYDKEEPYPGTSIGCPKCKSTLDVCGDGKCIKSHPMHCCHTATTRRQALRRGAHIVWPGCVTCGRDWKATTMIKADQFGHMV